MNRILIAAGDQASAEGIQSALSSAGYQTAVVGDCQQLVAFCQQHTPDLTVVDLSLPGGSIWAALQALKNDSRLAAMPLVGVGAQPSEAEQAQAATLGISAIEPKPISPPSLVDRVRNSLALGEANNITQMPAPQAAAPASSGGGYDPVGLLVAQISEIRQLTFELKPGLPVYGEEGPELFSYIENSGNQIQEELDKLAAHGSEQSSVALQDKDLRHDFRNMIGSVTGFSELLLMEPTVTGDARGKFTRIREICRDFCDILDQQKAAAA